MREILTCVAFSLACVTARAQMDCCSKNVAVETFAQLAGDPVFQMYHADPRPFHFEPEGATQVHFSTPDGSTASAMVWKATNGSHDWLLVFHEWWGLNDYVKRESERLWKDLGINVLAVDLYDGKVAATRDSAVKLVQSAKPARGVAIIQGALSYIGGDARVFTIGWCYGGGWSLQASLLAGTQAAGCVMYYGQPEKDVTRLKGLHCDVLGIFADKDGGITPAVVAQFAADMLSAGKSLEVHHYNAVHAFANPSNPDYDALAAADAYTHTLTFLKARL
ncbi:MAG TPA: dienelactone hydrolase family protein [Dinghuibacter sp.]|uniref:dienelactone hydrolase family protein n=1 Tax=Dinghuibacter sp. TaxID=2024697 RepID=UPI002BAE4A51|nr:dienelactone hydrolase family protein [Dinghuibacter sp.]HTJ12417.1 dienelactone hydrolase family protein [Dinghuibacter sp.]